MQTLSPPPAYADRLPDTWVATDAIGRPLPTFREVGSPKANRTVGIFYFLWLGQHTTSGPHDISKFLTNSPINPTWGPEGHFHHWGEPELGYYVSEDEYVLRRHARLLTDAGVDVLILDVTNAFTYPKIVQTLCKVLQGLRSQGERTPQICFIAHSNTAATVQKLYDEVYKPKLAPELWYQWNQKPLLLANPDEVPESLRTFFTLRDSWAWTTNQAWFGNGRGKWPWLDHSPQEPGRSPTGKIEEVSVAVAEHPVSNIGRSFHNGKQPNPENIRPDQGLYFAEQWDHALEIDPPFVFVTGWNEWVAQRFIADGKGIAMQGRRLNAGESFFVDQFNQEFSRDIEPMRGGHGDNYYFQLIANIRRYKGVRPLPMPSAPQRIKIDGRFDDWGGVGPDYFDAVGDTEPRNSPGWGTAGMLKNITGRNDIRLCKVARDATNLSFAVVCTQDISPNTGEANWMTLYLDTDQNGSTGWNGYDFRVAAGKLQRWRGEDWTPVCPIKIATKGTRLELQIPRQRLGQQGRVAFDFHWADNWQTDRDIQEFSLHGESAPDRRFNYRYEEPLPVPKPRKSR